VPDAALRDDMVSNMPHLRLRAAEDGHLHAAPVIEMHVHRGVRELMMVMEQIGQSLRHFARIVVIDIDQCGYAVPVVASGLSAFAHSGAGEVANCFRPVLIPAAHDYAVEFRCELVIDSDGQALH
jgi:hypothetical protein